MALNSVCFHKKKVPLLLISPQLFAVSAHDQFDGHREGMPPQYNVRHCGCCARKMAVRGSGLPDMEVIGSDRYHYVCLMTSSTYVLKPNDND